MCSRRSQFDMAHTLTTYFSLSNFNTTFFADNTAVFQTLVLTAQAFVIFYWPKDTGAEKAVTFWFERTVVNGFRLLNFAERPRTDHVWRGQSNFDRVKLFGLSLSFQKLQ